MVAGAADGLEPASVAVVVAEASASPPARVQAPRISRTWLAGSALALAVVLGAIALSTGRRRREGA
jgi:type III secretory pathway lipoprotein EscJ